MRILAISDERDPSLTPERCREIGANLVVSCGDLELDYLDYIASAANATLVMVPGNHDANLRPERLSRTPGPFGFTDVWGNHGAPDDYGVPGINADDKIVTLKGVTFAGLGGSIHYNEGPNQYTERQMARRARRLKRRLFLGRQKLDVLLTHSPPAGLGDESDGPHEGFACFLPLIEALRPKLMLHGHIHPHGYSKPDRELGDTRIVNVIPHKVIDL